MMTPLRWLAALGVGVLIGGVLLLTDARPAHAVLGGLLWLVVVLVLTHLDLGEHVDLPRLPYGRRDGDRTEVATIASAFNGTGTMQRHGHAELRRTALGVLADAGLDLGTEADRRRVTALLGSEVVAVLLDPQAPPPHPRAVRSAVLALETMTTTTEDAG